jgi:hypothetical protein
MNHLSQGGHKTKRKMEKKILMAIVASMVWLPFWAAAQESADMRPAQDSTLQQKPEPAQTLSTTDREKYRRKGYIGLTFGVCYIPTSREQGIELYPPAPGINFGYLFSPHTGIAAKLYLDGYNAPGLLAGPLFSTAIDKREKIEWDFRPMIGLGYKSYYNDKNRILFEIGTSIRFNTSNYFSLSANLDFYPNLVHYGIYQLEFPSDDFNAVQSIRTGTVKSSGIALTLGANYRLGSKPPKTKPAPEWLYRGKTNRFGVKAGLNLASTTDCTLKSGRNTIEIYGGRRTAFHVGVFDNYSFTNRFGVQAEALYSVQGDEDKLSYINLPILMDVRLTRNLGFLIGPQMGINVSKPEIYDDNYRLTLSSDGISTDNIVVLARNNETAAVDFALVFGARYTLLNHLVIDARYNLGRTPVRTFKSVNNTTVSGYHNDVFQASVGWLF